MSIEREFDGYLELNWKTGEMKLLKTSRAASGYWVPIHLRIQLVVPEWQPEVAVRLELSEAKLKDIVIETLGQ